MNQTGGEISSYYIYCLPSGVCMCSANCSAESIFFDAVQVHYLYPHSIYMSHFFIIVVLNGLDEPLESSPPTPPMSSGSPKWIKGRDIVYFPNDWLDTHAVCDSAGHYQVMWVNHK